MTTETLILKNLIHNENYMRVVLPYLKEEYFKDSPEEFPKTVFGFVNSFIGIYNERPSLEAIRVSMNEMIADSAKASGINDYLNSLTSPEPSSDDRWIIDKTEKYCKDRAIENALLESIHIINDPKEKRDRGAIPTILTDALSVSFDPSVGHDYFLDAEKRYDFYNRRESKIPFGVEYFNKITNGGLARKTLNVILGGTNIGKTLAMCSFTTDFLTAGKNVLYITMEMSEERISERIDANLLDISLETLRQISKAQYTRMINNAKKNISGRLFVKEYPTASANVLHFRKLLTELQLKKKFVPDIIVVDYLSICASSRIKGAGVSNTYVLVKSIAEELRGLAVENDVALLTGAQVTRSGFNDSDFDMTHVAESWGIATSADLMFALVSTEELEKSSQYLVKQLKNRYSDKVINKKHIVGVNKSKMRIFDVKNDSSNLEYSEPTILLEGGNRTQKFEDWFNDD